MIMWNYRVIKEDGLYYLAEVFYENGKAHSWSEPVTGHYESRIELIQDLRLMIKDSSFPTMVVKGDTIVQESTEQN